MNQAGMRKVLAALAVLLAVQPAFADMAAFNAAVRVGDFRAASAEAKTIWPGYDKGRADALAVAREFGFASYMAGDYAAARDYGTWLTGAPADPQPASSAVLLRAAGYRLDPSDANRDALLEAVSARTAAPGIDNISVLAADLVYKRDWGKFDWPAAIKSSQVAIDLFSRAGGAVLVRKHDASVINAAANFFNIETFDDYDRMVDVHEAIIADIDRATDPGVRAGLVKAALRAQAWTLAMEAYFAAIQFSSFSVAPKKLDVRKLSTPKTPYFPEDPDPRPRCPGRLDDGAMQYPASKEFSKLVGAVIVKVDFDDKGRASNGEVLAAVPSEEFSSVVLGAVPGFRWIADRSADRKTCRMSAKNVVLPFTFKLR